MDHPELRYLEPEASQTLREAIVELREAEAASSSHGDMSGEVTESLGAAMEPHDAVHVIFGCRTDLLGEIRAHLWMLLGTTARMSQMHRTMQSRDHRRVLREIGFVRLVFTWLRALPTAAGVAAGALRMAERWPIDRLGNDLDRPLREIRAELGVRL